MALSLLFLAALDAGAAQVSVAPERFPVIVNCGFTEKTADKLTSPLLAKALVLREGGEELAIAIVDSCMMPRDLVDRAKREVTRRTGLREDRQLIAATHTHFAPAAMGCLGSDAEPGYADFLAARVAEAIVAARQRLAPAEAGAAAVDDAAHTFNRRFLYRPGKELMDPFGQRSVRANMHPGYQNPDTLGPSGPIDPALTVLAIRARADRRPIAVLANYSMHYFASQPLSADYAGVFAEQLTAKMAAGVEGFVAMLSQGTSGDLMWMDYASPKRDLKIEEYTAGLTESALRALGQIRYAAKVPLAMAETRLTLGRRVPDAARLAWARQLAAAFAGRKPKTQPEIYAREAIYLYEEPRRELKLQALRIGELALTALPNEVFAITGLKLKARSPLALTMNLELANGSEGYIPPPEQHALGGYTTWPARTAGLEVEAEPKIVAAIVTLLEQVTGRPARKPAAPPAGGALRASKPALYWPMDDLETDPARFVGPHALALEGVRGRAVHFVGGRLAAPAALPAAERWTWEAWQSTAPGVWQHVAAVCAGGDRGMIFRDGGATGGPMTCAAARDAVLPAAFVGKMDEVAYFSRALSAGEIQRHAAR